MGSESSEPTLDSLSDDILSGMREWHEQHPTATLADIEHALDERWYRLRARLLAEAAQQREAARWQATSDAARPTCPNCGRTLIRRGRHVRRLKTYGGHTLTLTRSYGYCPTCRKGLFPPR